MKLNSNLSSLTARVPGRRFVDILRDRYHFEKYMHIALKMLLLLIAIQIGTWLLPFIEAQDDSNSPNPPFVTYENSVYGIKFNYPSSWYLKENLTGISVALFPNNDSVNSEIQVAIKDVPGNITVDKYAGVLAHELEKKIADFNFESSRFNGSYEISRNEWPRIMTFTGLYMKTPIKGVSVYTTNENKAYVLTFLSQKDLYSKLFPEAQVLIDSFEVYKDLTQKNVTIGRDNPFEQGAIEFSTRFDNTYGRNAAVKIRLDDFKTNGIFQWTLRHNSSVTNPNTYSIEQRVNDTWTTKQGSLNQTIGYGKWYHVRLSINGPVVSFYLNDSLAATFKRPSNDTYSYLQLKTESAAVSFENVQEFTSSGIPQSLMTDPSSWYSEQETFKYKKFGDNWIFTLIPIYPPLGVQSVRPPLNDNNLTVERFATGLNFPTSMAFIGPNDILITEKNEGIVKRFVNGNILPEPVLDVKVANKNERGMLGIAAATRDSLKQNEKEDVKAKSDDSIFVFLYYTESNDKDGDDVTNATEPLGNRLYRYEFVNDKLVNPKLLLDLPTTSSIHNGGKIVIGPDRNIYLVVGNLAQNDSKAQNNLSGKNPDGTGGVLYITPDGNVVENILGKEGYLANYYAYGIRNSFGIGFDPITGILWDTENGPATGDEINLVRPGFNSGWKEIQGIWKDEYKTNDNALADIKDLVNFNGKGKYSDPEFVWQKTVGVTDLIFLNSSKLGKNYENDMFVGDFHNGYLYHFKLNNDRTELLLEEPLADKLVNIYEELENVIFGEGFGGITDLEIGPDGYIYVLAVNLGGGDCDPDFIAEDCVTYNGKNMGSIFRIVPVRSHS